MRRTRAQKFVTLSKRYEAAALTLRAQSEVSSEQEEHRAIGRLQALTWIADELSSLTADTKPARLQVLVENTLASLSEQKAAWLITCIRERWRHSVTQAGEWMGEGAMVQIDEISQELRARLTPQWNATSPKQHGLCYQVYHSTDPTTDVEIGKQHWQSSERGQWFQEVAIVKVRSAEQAPEEVLRRTSGSQWPDYPGTMWSLRQSLPLRPTAAGDIIVSLLSGATWIVEQNGFQAIVITAPKEEQVEPPR